MEVYKGVNTLMKPGNLDRVSNLNFYTENPYKSSILKRATEVAMRTTDIPVPFKAMKQGYKYIKATDRNRLKDIKNYILFNEDNGWKSKSLAPTLDEYNGGLSAVCTIPLKNDILDAGLYGRIIDDEYATLKAIGKDFGAHEGYINEHKTYRKRKPYIQVYEVNDADYVKDYGLDNVVHADSKDIQGLYWKGRGSNNYTKVKSKTNNNEALWNHGGYLQVYGTVKDTRPGVLYPNATRDITFKQDIYKFFSDDFNIKWKNSIDFDVKDNTKSKFLKHQIATSDNKKELIELKSKLYMQSLKEKLSEQFQRKLIKYGLPIVDRQFTPVILRGTKVAFK